MSLRGVPGTYDNDLPRDHLRQGQTVCPYAHGAERAGRLRHVPLTLEPLFLPQDVEQMQLALNTLVKNSEVEGVLFSLPDAPNHVDALRYANRAFFLARYCVLPDASTPATDFEDRYYPYLHTAWAQLEPAENFIHVPQFNDRLFAFAMNPVYGRGHPRFMPRSVMVLTRWSDIVSAREAQPNLVQEIISKARRAVIKGAQEAGIGESQAWKTYEMGFYELGPTEWPKGEDGQPYKPVNSAKYFNSYWE